MISSNGDLARWLQYLPGWIALFVGWLVAVVGWGFRVEKLMAKGTGRQDELTAAKDEMALEIKDLGQRLQGQGDSIIELKADVRYIREGIDELKRRRRG